MQMIIQAPYSDLIGIVAKNGWPVAIILMGAWIFKTAIWPRIVKYLDNAEAAQQKAQKILEDQLTDTKEVQRTLLQDFKRSIDANTNLTSSMAAHIDQVVPALREIAVQQKEITVQLQDIHERVDDRPKPRR